jgi:hypothetical protein
MDDSMNVPTPDALRLAISDAAEEFVFVLTGRTRPGDPGNFAGDPKFQEYKEQYDRSVSNTKKMLSSLGELNDGNISEAAELFVNALTGRTKPDESGRDANDSNFQEFVQQYDRSIRAATQILREFSKVKK